MKQAKNYIIILSLISVFCSFLICKQALNSIDIINEIGFEILEKNDFEKEDLELAGFKDNKLNISKKKNILEYSFEIQSYIFTSSIPTSPPNFI